MKIFILLIFQSYVALHSFGQKICYPWGYTSNLIEDWYELQEMGEIMSKEIKKSSGLHYRVGPASRVEYQAIGGSSDWARGEMGIKWTYFLELPPTRSTRENGFMLPLKYILPTAESIFRGIREMGIQISHKIAP